MSDDQSLSGSMIGMELRVGNCPFEEPLRTGDGGQDVFQAMGINRMPSERTVDLLELQHLIRMQRLAEHKLGLTPSGGMEDDDLTVDTVMSLEEGVDDDKTLVVWLRETEEKTLLITLATALPRYVRRSRFGQALCHQDKSKLFLDTPQNLKRPCIEKNVLNRNVFHVLTKPSEQTNWWLPLVPLNVRKSALGRIMIDGRTSSEVAMAMIRQSQMSTSINNYIVMFADS